MKKILLAVLFLTLPATATTKLKVVTTIPDLAALTREVGQELVEVQSIARGDQDPHYIEPKPSYALTLNRADLLIDAGLELESGWLPVLLVQSRNPKVQPGNPGYLSAWNGITILEIPSGGVDRSQGDVHPSGNPHYWLDPRNGLKIAEGIAERLSLLDPSHATLFRQYLQGFETRFKGKIAGWERQLTALKGRPVITYHKSFSYFADWVGLNVVDLIEPKPGIPPSPSHILLLIDRIKSRNISLIITENYYDPKASHELSEKTGAKVLLLPTSVGGEAGIKTYEDLFETIVKKLKETL